MTAKWKQIESYVNFQPIHEIELTKFNITQDQARLILDLKKAELAKFKFLSMLDISKKEVKQLAKIDPTIVKAIGKQGGSFRTSMVRQRAGQPTTHTSEDAPTVSTGPAIAGTGDDSSTVIVRKKKKKQIITGDKPMTRIDART